LAESFFGRLIADTQKPWSQRDVKIGTDAAALVKPAEWGDDENGARLTVGIALGLSAGSDEARWRELEQLPAQRANLLGRQIVKSTVAAMDMSARDLACRVETNLTRTFLALCIYQRKYGRLPPVLTELVKDGLLSALPPDLFTNEPLLYSPDTRTLRSAGPADAVLPAHLKSRLELVLPQP